MKTVLIPDLKPDFPILQRKVNGKPLVYLDSAATSQKPRQVIDAMDNYYKQYNANVHRGVHKLSEEATVAYEEAHQKVADFINAGSMEEIVFTKNATESLNLLMYSYGMSNVSRGDEILLTRMEHHSNLVPWQFLAGKTGARLNFLEIKDGRLVIDSDKFTGKTKIVSVSHMSNVLGTVNDVRKIAKLAHDAGAICIVDAAQSVPHMPVDVNSLGCDFLAFSGHKMLGPTGIGVLYGKKALLEAMSPFLYGGDMIKSVSYEKTEFNDLPWKFEAGTPNIAGGIGLTAAVDYLQDVGMAAVLSHEKRLTEYALSKLSGIKGVALYGPKTAESRGGVVSFNVGKVHPHDASAVLDSEGIAVRGGHHCAMPLMKLLGINSSVRASFYLYNSEEDVDRLVSGIRKVQEVFA